MFVVVYPDGLQPPWLLQRYHGALDVQSQSAVDEPRPGYIPEPLAVRYASQRAQQLFYRQQWAEDVQAQSAVNEPRDGWRPRPLFNAYHPQFGLLYFGEDTSQSAAIVQPATASPWVVRRLQQPYLPRPSLVEWSEALDVQAQSAVNEPRDGWRPRLLPCAWVLLRRVYYQQQDWASSNVEGGLSWTPEPLWIARLPRGTPYYYFSSTVPEQNVEGGLSWVPTPLQVPRLPLGAVRGYYWSATAQDTSAVVVTDTPVPWVGRRLPVPWAFPYGLYQWNTAQDTSAPAPAPGVPQVSVQPPWLRRLRLMSQQRPGR